MIDEYSVFYFQFNPQKNPAGSFKQVSTSPKYKSWAGFAFESLCIRHSHKIKEALGISGIFSTESSFYFKGNKSDAGFQLDMLIDRSDNSINICEMKFYGTEYNLSSKEADPREKKRVFQREDKNQKIFNQYINYHFWLKTK